MRYLLALTIGISIGFLIGMATIPDPAPPRRLTGPPVWPVRTSPSWSRAQ